MGLLREVRSLNHTEKLCFSSMLENEILFEIRLKVQMMNFRKATKDDKIKKEKGDYIYEK